jgi:hypothetical protein
VLEFYVQIQRYFSPVAFIAVSIGARKVFLDLKHLPSATLDTPSSHILLMLIKQRLNSKITYLNFSDLLFQSVELLVGGLSLGVA